MNGNEMNTWPKTVMDFNSPAFQKDGGTLPEVQLLQDCKM
jgi:hypothetical protein